MRRLLHLLIISAIAATTVGCAAWDGLVEFERRKNEWLFGPSAELPRTTAVADLPGDQTNF